MLQAYGALAGRGAAGKFGREQSRVALIKILLRAYAAALRRAPAMWRKRRQLKKLVRVDRKEIDRWFRRFGISAREISWTE